VREGLKRLAKPECCGLEALLKVSGVKTPVSAGHIAFSLAPRLNAAGRMSLAQSSLQLLLTAKPEAAEVLAQELDEENKLRQETERSIVEAAVSQCENRSLTSQNVLIVAGENWHPGVIGIVASRLVERYYRPAMVLSVSEDGWAKGSCRSIPGFDMHQALQACGHLLERFGGHKQAAGLTMRAEKITALQEAMNQQAEQMLQKEDYVPKVFVDALVSLDMVNEALLERLELLEPYGIGNPRPRMLLQNLHLQGEARRLGKEREHLKLTVQQNKATCPVLAWRQGEKACYLPSDTLIDVVATPEGNLWRDELQVQLVAEDFAPSRQEENQAKLLDYLAPDMSGLRQLYAAMRYCLQLANCQEGLTPEQLRRQLHQQCRLQVASAALAQALDVFSEVCLIAYTGENAKIALLPPPEKRLDISATQGYEQGCLLRQEVLDNWLQRVEIQGLSQTWI
jgi:single-stranded-DNA-specific exonuclease